MRATNVSIYADQNYKNALSILAMRENMKVAQLVRNALDSLYGTELENIQKEFLLLGGVQGRTKLNEDE
jgi:hypothetical protein